MVVKDILYWSNYFIILIVTVKCNECGCQKWLFFLETDNRFHKLGIDISSDLSWDTHINCISKKANNTLGFLTLRRNIKIHFESLKSSAYKVLVSPQLEYCSTVWCPLTDSNISKLEAVQRRVSRWVKHDYGQTSSVTEMMQSLHWCRLDQQRIDNKLSLMYKTTLNLIAIPISDFLIPLVRPSRYYHPLSYRLITATTDLLQIFILSKSCISLEQPSPSKLWPAPP